MYHLHQYDGVRYPEDRVPVTDKAITSCVDSMAHLYM